jgi:hypothetical protein
VSKKWLIRLKKRLMKKVTLDWDKVGKASGKATFLVCAKHNSMIGMMTFFYFGKGLFREIFSVANTDVYPGSRVTKNSGSRI